MDIEFGTLKRKGLKEAAELAARAFEVFHTREFIYDGKKMGSWSVKKIIK